MNKSYLKAFSILLIMGLSLLSGCTINDPEVIKVSIYDAPKYNSGFTINE